MSKGVSTLTFHSEAHKEYVDGAIQTALLSQETCDTLRRSAQNMSLVGKLFGKIASATECLKVFYHVGNCVRNWRNGRLIKKDIINASLSIASTVFFGLGTFLSLPSAGLSTAVFYPLGYACVATYQVYNHKHYKATREQVIQDDIASLEAQQLYYQRCLGQDQDNDPSKQAHYLQNLHQVNAALRQAKTAQQQVEQEKAQKNKPSRPMRHMIYEGIAGATVTAGSYIISAGVSLGVAASNLIWGVASVATLAQLIDSPIPGKIKRGFKKGFQKVKQALTGVKQDNTASTPFQFKNEHQTAPDNPSTATNPQQSDPQPAQKQEAHQPKNSWWQRFAGWFTKPKPAPEIMSDNRGNNPSKNDSIPSSEQQTDTVQVDHQVSLDNDTMSIQNKLQFYYGRDAIKNPHKSKSRQQADQTLNQSVKPI